MVSHVLEDAWNTAEPRLRQIHAAFLSDRKKRSPHVARATQLDAELLDQELVQLLLEPIRAALSLISVCCRSLYYIQKLIKIDLHQSAF